MLQAAREAEPMVFRWADLESMTLVIGSGDDEDYLSSCVLRDRSGRTMTVSHAFRAGIEAIAETAEQILIRMHGHQIRVRGAGSRARQADMNRVPNGFAVRYLIEHAARRVGITVTGDDAAWDGETVYAGCHRIIPAERRDERLAAGIPEV